MATPTKFPAWLSRSSDGSVAIVGDLASYNAGVAQGYVYPVNAIARPASSTPARVVAAGMPVTPKTVVAQSGALTTTISQISVNGEQDDDSPTGSWVGSRH